MIEQGLVYSHDEEYFNDTTLADAVGCADALVGDEVVVYSGVPVRYRASDFLLPTIYELLDEGAYEEAGEYCDNWPCVSKEARDDLQEMVKDMIDAWASLYEVQPTFYTVKDIKPIRVLIEEDGYSEVADSV